MARGARVAIGRLDSASAAAAVAIVRSSASWPRGRATTFARAFSAISAWPEAMRVLQAPSRTRSRRTRSMSSRTFRATPSVSSSEPVPSSASSARAHVIVSPTPGSL